MNRYIKITKEKRLNAGMKAVRRKENRTDQTTLKDNHRFGLDGGLTYFWRLDIDCEVVDF